MVTNITLKSPKMINNKMDKTEILQKIDRDILQFKDPAGLYHPIFGLQDRYESKIQRTCDDRCQMILNLLCDIFKVNNPFTSNILKFISLLDIGSNLGYNTLYLSQYVHSIDGYEVIKPWRDFSDLIKEYNGITNVRFIHGDIRNHLAELDSKYNVCLFLSVIHYFVEEDGLEKTIDFLNNLISKFDFTIMEFSTHKEYSYMPEDLNDIFSKLNNCQITFVGNSEKQHRPIYLIRRTKLTIGSKDYHYDYMTCGQSMNKQNKIYYCNDKIIKITKNDHQKSLSFYQQELNVYDKLKFYPFIPHLYEHFSNDKEHILVLEYLPSMPLAFLIYYKKIQFDDLNKLRLVYQLIHILDIMLENNICWNDIEFQNMMIIDHKLKVYDFQEAHSEPLYLQRMYLYWMFYDLSKNAIVSRNTPSPERIIIFNHLLESKILTEDFGNLTTLARLLITSNSFKHFLQSAKAIPEYQILKEQPIEYIINEE